MRNLLHLNRITVEVRRSLHASREELKTPVEVTELMRSGQIFWIYFEGRAEEFAGGLE